MSICPPGGVVAEPRGFTLLDLAIFASAAVLPVLLCVLLVASTFGRAQPEASAGRYVSASHVAALKTFEYAIVRRDKISAEPPDAQALLDKLPACRGAWGERPGLLVHVERMFSDSDRGAPPQAQRVAAQLAQLDRALARFSSADNRRVSVAVGLDYGRWIEAAAQALDTPAHSTEYPDRRFKVRCSDLAAAVNAVARGDGRMLDALAWRGTAVAPVVARWRPEQLVEISAGQVARSNPWGGLPGCTYLGGPANAASVPGYFVGGAQRLCAQPAMAGVADKARPPAAIAGEPGPGISMTDPRWMVPPSLDAMLRPLQSLQRPSGELYRAYTEADAMVKGAPTGYRYGPNRIELNGNPVDVGFSVDLTIEPAVQALAQKTAACYTGRQDACRALAIRRREDGRQPVGHLLLEQAAVRMAAVAIIDIASGRIDALAGALSPCTRQGYDGPGLGSGCDRRLPYRVKYRSDALLNPAVFHVAMPGSVIKPIMAAAFLGDPGTGRAPDTAVLRSELARSDSQRFLDRMFCAEKGFSGCGRAAHVQAAALSLGWNASCSGQDGRCGERDLLFGRAADATAETGLVQPLANSVPYGRLLAEPTAGKAGSPFRLMSPGPVDAEPLRLCATGPDGVRPSKDDWTKCRGASVVDIVAEGWGQGHARASALGVAGMMAAVAAAANGQTTQRAPHLVRAVRGVGPADAAQLNSAVVRWSLADALPVRLPRGAATVILDGLSTSHRGGTAQLACEQVFDARKCREIDWLAGKTGTPSFPNDGRSLDQLARLCGDNSGSAARDPACRSLRPYKWYVAAYRSNPADPRWTKVIAVLAERNWQASDGHIQGAGDHGPNPAAEIAMQIAGRLDGRSP